MDCYLLSDRYEELRKTSNDDSKVLLQSLDGLTHEIINVVEELGNGNHAQTHHSAILPDQISSYRSKLKTMIAKMETLHALSIEKSSEMSDRINKLENQLLKGINQETSQSVQMKGKLLSIEKDLKNSLRTTVDDQKKMEDKQVRLEEKISSLEETTGKLVQNQERNGETIEKIVDELDVSSSRSPNQAGYEELTTRVQIIEETLRIIGKQNEDQNKQISVLKKELQKILEAAAHDLVSHPDQKNNS